MVLATLLNNSLKSPEERRLVSTLIAASVVSSLLSLKNSVLKVKSSISELRVLLQSLLILTNTVLLLRVFLLFFSETENLELALSSLALLGLVVSTVLPLMLVVEDMPPLLVLGLLSNILVTTDIWIRLERLLKLPEELPRRLAKSLNFKSSEILK